MTNSTPITPDDKSNLRSLPWTGDPILDACAVQANYGHLLLLTSNGALHGINIDSGDSVPLCKVDLPEITNDGGSSYFGAPRYRLHATPDGTYAAIVVDKEQDGIVVETKSGAITMHLNGGDYHENTVPFSACFLRINDRNVFVHRTAWNRLDATDPATGKSLTDRYIAPYTVSSERPAHYLDYFHGQLLANPDGSRIFDDGWVWHPVSIPRTWSMTDWLESNPWESEDGASIVELTYRDEWTTPACWINNKHIALWGLGEWNEEECAEIAQGTGVRILDATQSDQPPGKRLPMEMNGERARDLFSDGERLYVATDSGTTVWDLDTREQIANLAGFTACLHDVVRGTLIAFGTDFIAEFSIAWTAQ